MSREASMTVRARVAARADELAARLERLEVAGAARFDPPSCRCIRALLDRADALANQRLLDRAAARLDRLDGAMTRARTSTEAKLDDLTAARVAGTSELRAALRRHDIARARRGLRRLRVLPPLSRHGDDHAAQERYRRAAAGLSAALTVARARANMPHDAGPYNSTLVATHTLDHLATTSPTYLHALVERLEELAELARLAPPPEPEPPTRKRRSGSSAKRRAPVKPKARSARRRRSA